MGIVNCVLYIGILGILAYPLGRIISKHDPDPDGFLFRERPWELGGKIYEKLHIKSWQARVPDVSQVLHRWMPQKKLKVGVTPETVRTMIRETCTAEAVHNLLNLAGLWLLGLQADRILFVKLVQRYNRHRLKALLNHLEMKEVERENTRNKK